MLIKQSLLKSATEHNTEYCHLPHIIQTVWDARFLKQVTSLHVVASLLVPENHAVTSMGQTPEVGFGPIMTDFFQRYAPPDQVTNCMRDFWAFRRQSHAFFPHENSVWVYMNDPVTFWDTAAQFCPILGHLASRLMQVPGNSVPGERAWSIQNLILSKPRNMMKQINLDRLLFIYINERILNRPSGPSKKKLPYIHGILASDEELAQLEDLLLQNKSDNGLINVEEGEDQDQDVEEMEE